MSNPGYTFVGWNTAADGSGTEYAAGATYVFSGNQTLYAQWSPDTYVVTFSYDGGATGITSENFVVGTAALTLPTPTFIGSTFDGWYSAQTGGLLIGLSGSTYVPTSSIQLYAQWSSIAIDTLNFNANGGVGSITSYSADDGTLATLPTIDGITFEGYAFGGWNTEANGSGTQYAEGQSLTLTGSETLYAQWTAGPSYTVTFDANGGSGSIDPINGTPGSTITLPDQSGLIHARLHTEQLEYKSKGNGHRLSGWSRSEAVRIVRSLCAMEWAQDCDALRRDWDFQERFLSTFRSLEESDQSCRIDDQVEKVSQD